MEFLVEQTDATNQILTENTGSKKYIIEGVCLQTNILNRNKRKYPKDAVAPEVARYIREDIANNRALGELNHPQTDPRINYERVSHKFESLVESGDDWIGRAVVTKNTPMGSIVAGLMDAGVQMGISTRAVGSTRLMEGYKVVQKDFHLISAGDIVSDPSAPDAYLTNLMEGKEWVWANGVLVERESEIKNSINTLAKRKQLNEEALTRLFKTILKQI